MKPNYCLPIIEASKTEALGLIQDNLEDYHYFEVWLDYVENADEAFVKRLTDLLGNRLVVTFRRRNLETPMMDPGTRQNLLAAAADTPVFVDLDVKTQQDELNHIKDKALRVKTIVSYHNYEETPDTLQLGKIIDTMKTYQPAVYKLSTLCRTAEDAVRLLRQLLKLKDSGLNVIVSGMGEHGAVTRIFGTLWGNEMVFAPLTKESGSAPGQLTRQQLETIFKELGT
jgi:3-dehydroquinate dehydratase-1